MVFWHCYHTSSQFISAGLFEKIFLITDNNSDAAINLSGSAKVMITATDADFTAKADVDNPTFTTGITSPQVDITAQGDLRLQDSAGGQYVALQAPATISSSYTLTMPTADGSADQVLTTNGSGTLSFADAGGGGAYSFVSSATISNDAEVEFTFSADTNVTEHRFMFLNVVGVNSSYNFYARMRNASTQTYYTGNTDYEWGFQYFGVNTTPAATRDAFDTQIEFAHSIRSATPAAGINGRISFFNPSSTTLNTACEWQFYASYLSGLYGNSYQGVGGLLQQVAADRVKFYLSSGNLNTGSIYYYTLSKS